MKPYTGANLLAPLASAGLILAIILTGGLSPTRPAGVEAYHAQVAATIDAVPLRIGDWQGVDVTPMPEATELLQPNRILQRRYRNLRTGNEIELLVVHCGDARDMNGHYPPVCYPNQGWVRTSSTDESRGPDGAVPCRSYLFEQRRFGETQTIRVDNFLVLPSNDLGIFRDIDALDAAARAPGLTGLGAAQVQIVGSGKLSAEEWDRLTSEFIDELEGVIQAVTKGISDGER